MTRNTDILNELMQISPLVAGISRQMPYALPGGYFETLDGVITARVAAGGNEENSFLTVAGKTIPQDVPAGYFNSLADSILEKLKTGNSQSVSDELKNLSPALAAISKENIYHAPAGYFENLSGLITGTVTGGAEAKIVSIFSRKVWMRLAAAAVVIGVIAFGINFFFSQPKQLDSFVEDGLKNYNTEKNLNDALAQVNTDDIYNYLQATTGEADTETITEMTADATELPAENEDMNDELLQSLMKELE